MARTIPRSVIVSTGISGSGTVSSTAMTAASSTRSFSATAPMTAILHAFERERDSLSDADAHGRERELSAVALKLLGGGKSQPRAGHAERVAKRNRAAVGIYARIVVGNAELAEDGKALRGEGFVQLDHVEIADLQAQPLHQFLAGRRRSDAHDPRRHPGDCCAKNSGARREAIALRRLFRRNDDRRRAIVDTRGVAGCHRAVGAHDRFELGE